MLNPTNCLNCGAPLQYSTNDYESMVKCPYCGTEYHIDRLGKVEEYKVKLQIMGAIHEFYVSEITLHNIYSDIMRNFNGNLTIGRSSMTKQQMELTLISM